jgi:hypothetical protein
MEMRSQMENSARERGILEKIVSSMSGGCYRANIYHSDGIKRLASGEQSKVACGAANTKVQEAFS